MTIHARAHAGWSWACAYYMVCTLCARAAVATGCSGCGSEGCAEAGWMILSSPRDGRLDGWMDWPRSRPKERRQELLRWWWAGNAPDRQMTSSRRRPDRGGFRRFGLRGWPRLGGLADPWVASPPVGGLAAAALLGIG